MYSGQGATISLSSDYRAGLASCNYCLVIISKGRICNPIRGFEKVATSILAGVMDCDSEIGGAIACCTNESLRISVDPPAR